jgi:P27 family predicted phage terminase small subunit
VKPAKGKGLPDAPEWLSPEARAQWDRLVPELANLDRVSPLDGPALARYCDAWSRWVELAKFLREKGEMYPVKDDHGRVVRFLPFPQAAEYARLSQLLSQLEQELWIGTL